MTNSISVGGLPEVLSIQAQWVTFDAAMAVAVVILFFRKNIKKN
jgi:hypothetical protein